MSEITLVLDRKNLAARMEASSVVIEQPGAACSKVPLNMIGQVVVMGSPMVSCAVWRALSQNGISAVILPARGKGEPAFLGPGLSGRIDLRAAQYEARRDPETALEIAKKLVRKKITGHGENLRLLQTAAKEFTSQIDAIDDLAGQTASAPNMQYLMGLEGMAANLYFQGLQGALAENWGFSGRNRRPPKDPINALLSLSYVLAASEMRQAVFRKGLDPCIGFLHALKPNRESLVLDILEPVRPMVDRFVMELAGAALRPDQFTKSETEGCRLNKPGRIMGGIDVLFSFRKK